MKIIGLTGGIASGKSTVSHILENLGAVIIDADMIAREIVKPGHKVLNKLVEVFGNQILNMDGTLNRKFLGNIVFNDADKLELINNITHPEIRNTIVEKIDEIHGRCEKKIIIIDAAVLFESGLNKLTDEVWLVHVDNKTQIKRLIERDNMTLKEAEARIKSQMPVDDKIKMSDKIIDNMGDVKYTQEQVKELWNNL
jgi:dephospho-CoA kinase